MASIKTAYATPAAVTITLASLASDTSLLAGRASTAIDNSTNLYLDYLIDGVVMTGTTPTVSTQIEVHVVGYYGSAVFPDSITGTDANKTISLSGIKNSIVRNVAVMTVTATSNVAYPFGPVSVASLFGGVVPPKFVVWVVHNTAAALHATGGNHNIYVTGQYATST